MTTTGLYQLLVALYVRDGVQGSDMPGQEDLYHWALLVVPNQITETSRALRLHARNYFSESDSVTWYFEEVHVPVKGTSKLLATIPIGQVVDVDHLLEILRDIPIHQGELDWNCVSWIHEAFDELSHDSTALEVEGVGNDWMALRDFAMGAAARGASQLQYVPVH